MGGPVPPVVSPIRHGRPSTCRRGLPAKNERDQPDPASFGGAMPTFSSYPPPFPGSSASQARVQLSRRRPGPFSPSRGPLSHPIHPESSASQAWASMAQGMSRSCFQRGVPASGLGLGFSTPDPGSSWSRRGPSSSILTLMSTLLGGAPRSVFPRGVKNTTCPSASMQMRTPPS